MIATTLSRQVTGWPPEGKKKDEVLLPDGLSVDVAPYGGVSGLNHLHVADIKSPYYGFHAYAWDWQLA